MKPRRLSRTDQIELDLCLKNFDSRYDLILTAARRTRKMQKNADPWGLMVTPIDALLEAQSGELNRDHYMKPNSGLSAEDYYRGRLGHTKKKVVAVI